MARMPFDRWLKRILKMDPDPQLADAMDCVWGEEFLRALVANRKTDRVRGIYLMVRRHCAQAEEAVGRYILIDEGEMTICGTYGKGHVYTGGTIRSAEVVILEDAAGKRSLGFEVRIIRGISRKEGKFVRRIRGTYLVDCLPLGDRGQGGSVPYGGADIRGVAGDGDPWDVASRGTAGTVHGSA